MVSWPRKSKRIELGDQSVDSFRIRSYRTKLDEWGCRRRDSKTPTKTSRKRKVVGNNLDNLSTSSDIYDTIELATPGTSPVKQAIEPRPNEGRYIDRAQREANVPEAAGGPMDRFSKTGLEHEAYASIPALRSGEPSFNGRGSRGQTFLHLDAKNRSLTEPSSLLARTTDKNSVVKVHNKDGGAPLHLARYSQKPGSEKPGCPTIPPLLASRSDIDKANKYGIMPCDSMYCLSPEKETPGYPILAPGHLVKDLRLSLPRETEVVDLSTSGINHPVSKSSPTRCANPTSRKQSAESLLEHYMTEIYGKCAEDPCWQIARLLCEKVDITRSGALGNYPLHLAVYNVQHHAQAELVKTLLSRGADPKMLNSLGESAMMILWNSGTAASEVVSITADLLEAGVDSMEIRRLFLTALDHYDGDKRQQLTRLLLKAESRSGGANPLNAELMSEAQDMDENEDEISWEANWWTRWHSACALGHRWTLAKTDVLIGFTYLPLDIRGTVSKIAMEVVAQLYMDQAKKDLAILKQRDGGSTEEEREVLCDYMFSMIRDFRNDKLFPSDMFYGDLLDIYEAHPSTLRKKPDLYLRPPRLSSPSAGLAADGRQETVDWIDRSSSQSRVSELGATIRTMYGVTDIDST